MEQIVDEYWNKLIFKIGKVYKKSISHLIRHSNNFLKTNKIQHLKILFKKWRHLNSLTHKILFIQKLK